MMNTPNDMLTLNRLHIQSYNNQTKTVRGALSVLIFRLRNKPLEVKSSQVKSSQEYLYYLISSIAHKKYINTDDSIEAHALYVCGCFVLRPSIRLYSLFVVTQFVSGCLNHDI